MTNSSIIKYGILTLLVGVSIALAAFRISYEWKVKSDYIVKFKHEEADGIFEKFSGKLIFDDQRPEAASFEIAIDVKSVNTGDPMLNESIASDAWLDAEKYPTVTFKSTGAKKVGDLWETTGTLHLHGVEKEMTAPFTFAKNDSGGVFESNFSLAFNDFMLSEDSEEKITLALRVPVSK